MRLIICLLICCCAQAATKAELARLRFMPDGAEQLFRIAEQQQLEGDFAAAATSYREVIEHHRQAIDWSAPALANLVGCLRAAGDQAAKRRFAVIAKRYFFEPPAFESDAALPGERALEAILWKPWPAKRDAATGLTWRPGPVSRSLDPNERRKHRIDLRIDSNLSTNGASMVTGRLAVSDAEGRTVQVEAGSQGEGSCSWFGNSLRVELRTAERLAGPLRIQGELTLRQPSRYSYTKLPLDEEGETVTSGQTSYTFAGVEDGMLVIVKTVKGGQDTSTKTMISNGFGKSGGPLAAIDEAGRPHYPGRMSSQGSGDRTRIRLGFNESFEAVHLRIREIAAWSERQLPITLDGVETP